MKSAAPHSAKALNPFQISPQDAREFQRLLETRRDWIHRRVETIQLFPQGGTRRHVSLDLNAKCIVIAGMRIMPISTMKKKVLKSFDIRSNTGEALSVLTSEQTNQIQIAILRSGLLAPIRDDHDELLQAIVTFDRDYGRERLDADPSDEPGYNLLEEYFLLLDTTEESFAREMINWASLFISGFLLIVQLPNSVASGSRTVIKFSYDEPIRIRGIFRPRKTWVYLLTDWSKSYHLEVRTPPPIVVDELSVHRIRGLRKATSPIFRRQAYDVEGTQIAHVTISGTHPMERFVAFFYLRADTRGIPRAAFIGIILTCLGLNMLFSPWFPRLLDARPLTNSAMFTGLGVPTTILILAPSLLFAFLGKRADHDIEARIVATPRVLLFLSGIAMFVGALVKVHPVSETFWHLPVPPALPIVADVLLFFYGYWYIRGTNFIEKNGRWLSVGSAIRRALRGKPRQSPKKYS